MPQAHADALIALEAEKVKLELEATEERRTISKGAQTDPPESEDEPVAWAPLETERGRLMVRAKQRVPIECSMLSSRRIAPRRSRHQQSLATAPRDDGQRFSSASHSTART
ncbi:hypothetical protein Dda_8745 [Drechslerella dactyloides]|uniref:Uncharacterized protein n=1 Tax=Drechslerella dactyloides TaxID=74499 RepID=A0AAD6ISM5_DREDA|nr:hypothetical protein Dda_8745 [Drechslerella dactyloides]